ncbi:hypothetical protein BH23BAC4_BH23BAC4_01330 [soil metagenome]
MHLQITARKFEPTNGLRAYAERSLAKLERYSDGIHNARVILAPSPSAEKNQRAEVAVSVYRNTFSANAEGPTHEEAIDDCVKRLRRQVTSYKGRLRSKRSRAQARA